MKTGRSNYRGRPVFVFGSGPNLYLTLIFGKDRVKFYPGRVSVKPRRNRFPPFGVVRGRTVCGLPGVFILVDFVEIDRVLITGISMDIELQTARFVTVGSDGITHLSLIHI